MADVEPTLNPGFEGVVTNETNAVFLVGQCWIREGVNLRNLTVEKSGFKSPYTVKSDCKVGRANIVSPLHLNRIMHGS
jgi:hypothetical protein